MSRLRTPAGAVWISLIVFCAIVFSLLSWKYALFGYNAIDLAIYNQVFHNSIQGSLFGFSIHPHSYLGDHMELAIVLLLPLYAIWQSPLMLLLLQVVIVALGAWPLFMLAREKLPGWWSYGLAIAYLFNPFVLNMLFFEFHMLPLAMTALLWLFYVFYKQRFICFLTVAILAMTIREDVALTVLMFGVLAWVDRRAWRWRLVPLVIGALWFVGTIFISGQLNPTGSYKFFSLYGWLGDSIGAIIITIFTNPGLVLRHIFTIDNIMLLCGLLLPLAALPLFKIRYLIPAILPTVQLLLATVSATVALQTHYAALIIPFLFTSTVFAVASLRDTALPNNKLKHLVHRHASAAITILITAIIYSALTFSPLVPAVQSVYAGMPEEVRLYQQIAKKVPENKPVASSFRFLPHLSDREHLYSLHYVFQGRQQFSDVPYNIPVALDAVAIDFQDFLVYYLQSGHSDAYSKQYATGQQRINSLINSNTLHRRALLDTVALYASEQPVSTIPIKQIKGGFPAGTSVVALQLNNELSFIGFRPLETTAPAVERFTLYWQAHQPIDREYHFALQIFSQENSLVYEKLYPLGYGFEPTTDWEPGVIIATDYYFYIPRQYRGETYTKQLQTLDIAGYMALNGLRSATMKLTKREPVGSAIALP